MLDSLFGGPVAANDNVLAACVRCCGVLPVQLGAGRRRKFCDAECRQPPVFVAKNCEYCDKLLEGRRRKFCDETCRSESFKAHSRAKPKTGFVNISGECKECGDHFVGRVGKIYCGDACARKQRDFEYRRGSRAPERECQWCGEAFSRRPGAKDAALFCSRGCGHEYLRASSAIVKVSRFSVYKPRCSACDSPFSALGATAKYCSDACYIEVAKDRARQRWAANDNVDRSPRECPECRVVFSPEYGDRRSVYCTADCGGKHTRRISRAARKAALKAAYVENVDPIKVFDRDKWKCQICGVKTPRKLRGTYDDKAPELDHIMPLSLGGAHSYMNTQCACRKCNAAKSDTPPKQPSLFAYAA